MAACACHPPESECPGCFATGVRFPAADAALSPVDNGNALEYTTWQARGLKDGWRRQKRPTDFAFAEAEPVFTRGNGLVPDMIDNLGHFDAAGRGVGRQEVRRECNIWTQN